MIFVCIDHLYCDDHKVFHVWDNHQYAVNSVVESTGMEDAIREFEIWWISPFWAPQYVQGNQTFNNDFFKDHIKKCGIEFRPGYRWRVIESKHCIIRDV